MTETSLAGWTVVFDLDGTLVDTAPDLHAALNHSLTDGGYRAVPFETIGTMIGEGAKAMIRKGLAYQGVAPDDEVVEALWLVFLDYYRANICELSCPYPDAVDVVTALKADGANCAVCTNKTQQLAEQLLDGLGLASGFAAIVGADSVPHKKPDGDHILRTISAAGGTPDKAIMIGDSQTDERAALNSGLPFIFVPFGYGPSPDADASSLVIANNYSDVRRAIYELALRQPQQRHR